MIELDQGFFFEPRRGIVVRAVEDEKCALFLKGANAIDGSFVLNRPAADVAEEITAELGDQK